VADPDAEAAAAAEAGPATEEFSFNFSDAKKNNQWQPSDVEAALAYYAGEGAAGPAQSETPKHCQQLLVALRAAAELQRRE
jgi:hypothetical protein